jgi:hypothetical protein
MTKDITQQIEESRGLIEQTALSLEWLNVDMAHSKRLIAESRLLLEIADAAAVTATVLSGINTAGARSSVPRLARRPVSPHGAG